MTQEYLTPPASPDPLDRIFRTARSHSAWTSEGVTDAQLRELYDLMHWGPTSMNCQPARILFLRSPGARERLRPALLPFNVEKTLGAPVVAILAYDLDFFTHLDRLLPHHPGARAMFEGHPDLARETAFRNATLQGGYFLLAARAVGLDAGPMSGFDNAAVDAEFFPEGRVKSNFLCCLGHGDSAGLHERNPRLDFDDVCRIL